MRWPRESVRAKYVIQFALLRDLVRETVAQVLWHEMIGSISCSYVPEDLTLTCSRPTNPVENREGRQHSAHAARRKDRSRIPTDGCEVFNQRPDSRQSSRLFAPGGNRQTRQRRIRLLVARLRLPEIL